MRSSLFAVLGVAALSIVGDVACSSRPPVEDLGAIAQTADHLPIFLTTTKKGRPTGVVVHRDGYDSRIRVSHAREVVRVMSNEVKPRLIAREWSLTQTEFQEAGKTVLSYVMGFEALSRMAIFRGFSGGRELTCVLDFAHMNETGYGLMSKDLRSGGKSVAFEYAKWAKDSPVAPLACDMDAAFPDAARLMNEWKPLFQAKFDVGGVHYDGTQGVTPAFPDAGAPSTGTAPQDWWWTNQLTAEERIDIEISITAGVGTGLAAMKWGTYGGPEGMAGAGLAGFVIGFSVAWVKLKQDEEKAFIKEHEKKVKEKEDGRGSQNDEPGHYVEPRPSDVGWNGESSSGQERGGDDQGLQAGDIPSDTGAGRGRTGGYPGGNGTGGGPGGNCSDGPDDDGQIAVANLRPLTWCE